MAWDNFPYLGRVQLLGNCRGGSVCAQEYNRLTEAQPGQNCGVYVMTPSLKLRLVLATVVLLAFSYVAPRGFSQDQGSASPSSQPAPAATAPADQDGSTGSAQAPDSKAPGTATQGTGAPSDQNAPAPGADAKAQGKPSVETAPVQEADPSKVKHDGGLDDVDAIGNRKIGGRGLGNWYSIEGEIRMGKQYAQMVESSSKMVTDPVITEYVNRIGQNLVRNSDAQVPFTIKVIDADEINAFALPGGFFYVNTGLILAADEEAELAGVMAHEIAHVCARHATRQMTRYQLANISTIPLIFLGGGIGYAVRSAAGIGLPMTFLTFQRGFEAEADYLGLQYMYKAGYDPNAFIAFFEKIQAQEKKKPGTLAKAFATHPQTPDRIEASQKEIATILPARAEYTVTTSEFDEVKSRLAALENRHKVMDMKEAGKPSLRRASTTDSNGKDSTNEDDRPTLKRRDDSN
jgi:beta-barrel assembly-enhancing protease